MGHLKMLSFKIKWGRGYLEFSEMIIWNFEALEPMGTVRRRSKEAKDYIGIAIPELIVFSNKSKGNEWNWSNRSKNFYLPIMCSYKLVLVTFPVLPGLLISNTSYRSYLYTNHGYYTLYYKKTVLSLNMYNQLQTSPEIYT